MKKIGIAGYAGSGKTILTKFIAEKYGADVIDVDSYAKDLMVSTLEIKQKLKQSFGDAVVVNNLIDFKKLGDLSFSSLDNLKRLNAIVHPPLLKSLKSLLPTLTNSIIVLDAALISYWRIESWFDSLVWVEANRDIRLKRLLERTGLSRSIVENRVIIQEMLFDEPVDGAYCILNNESNQNSLIDNFINLEVI